MGGWKRSRWNPVPAEQRGHCRVLEWLQRIWTLVLLRETVGTKTGGDELHGQIYRQGRGWKLQFWMIWSWEPWCRHLGSQRGEYHRSWAFRKDRQKHTALKTHSFSDHQYTSISLGADSGSLLWDALSYTKTLAGHTCWLPLQGRSLFPKPVCWLLGVNEPMVPTSLLPSSISTRRCGFLVCSHQLILWQELQTSQYITRQQEEIIPQTAARSLIKSNPRDTDYSQKWVKAEQFCTWRAAQVRLGPRQWRDRVQGCTVAQRCAHPEPAGRGGRRGRGSARVFFPSPAS